MGKGKRWRTLAFAHRRKAYRSQRAEHITVNSSTTEAEFQAFKEGEMELTESAGRAAVGRGAYVQRKCRWSNRYLNVRKFMILSVIRR
jgi:hypothetical protein